MKNNTLLVCVGVVAFSLTAFSAKAQNITATLNEIDPSVSVKGTFDSGNTIGNYTSGVSQFSSSTLNDDFSAFCVEPNATITVGQTLTYQVTNLSGLTNSDKVAKLVGGYLSSAQTSADAAAIQWAIWEVTSETSSSKNLTNGSVKIYSPNTSVSALANTYLANINNYAAADIFYLTNSKYQNMIAWKGDAVPEPTSLSLLALSGALLMRRKRK
ncbi:thioester domain-containing protein [Luteolibacter algae]|uniref:Thioester domain-containing protein n=1 Tax=Luteolibacter algae TaxID=454151 RepID=A0ABW5DAZ2_9BACT